MEEKEAKQLLTPPQALDALWQGKYVRRFGILSGKGHTYSLIGRELHFYDCGVWKKTTISINNFLSTEIAYALTENPALTPTKLPDLKDILIRILEMTYNSGSGPKYDELYKDIQRLQC